MLISIHIVCVNKHIVCVNKHTYSFFLFLHCFLYYFYLTNLHTVCVNKHTYIIFRFCTERCDPPHERCRRQPATGMGNSRIGSIRRRLCSKCLYISDDLPQPDGVMACPKRRHASPGCGPVTDGAAAGTWRRGTDASGLHGVDVSLGLARMLLPGVLMGGPDTTGWCCGMSEEAARVSGAWPPSRTAPPPAPGGG